ncbi:MAG: PAS domain S-box protein [Geobacteraceae bacterium]|nr:PAS domain S-box protein [Geobacteraceae bacterium]
MAEAGRTRKQREKDDNEDRMLQERFRDFLTRIADGVVLVNRRGTVRFVNPAAETLLGRSAADLEGERFPFPLAEETSEITVTRPDRETRFAEMRVVETEWEGASASLVTLRDTTERRLMEERLRENQERLEELNRTLEEKIREEVDRGREKDHLLILQSRQAAMGEMIGSIAHQWRQPLTAVSLLIQDLGETYVYGDFTKEYLDATIRSALNIIQHMSQTIDDFRDFFRRDREPQAFSLRSIVDRALSFIETSLRYYTIAVDVDVDDDLIVFGYPNEFSQVLLNILGNAKDIFRERCTEKPVIRIHGFRENRKTVLTITDNGGGIPEEILDRIFEPYFTTRKRENGTGIGLWLSKTIIEKNMEGTLTACNVEGGARFRIEVGS